MACVIESYTPQLALTSGDAAPAAYEKLAEEALQALTQPATTKVGVLRAGVGEEEEEEDKLPVEQTPWGGSYFCSDELMQSIHHTMREREFGARPLQLQSPHLQKREYLVDLTTMVSELLGISPRIRFLAVLLMDHFMDSHIVMEFRLQLVALTCLYVAAKLEERDDRIPAIESLQKYAQVGPHNSFTIQEVHKMELYLLQFYNWCISYPTAVHFADIYLAIESSKQGQTDSPLLNPPEEPLQTLANYTSHFLETSIRDYSYLQYTSSEVAAAAVSAAHASVGSRNTWSEQLEQLTGYSATQLTPIVDQMLGLHEDTC